MKSISDYFDARQLWVAESQQASRVTRSGPENVFAEALSHEIFFKYGDELANIPPVGAVLPYLRKIQDTALAASGTAINPQQQLKKLIVFIGKEVWPTPFYLQACFPFFDSKNFLFIDTKNIRQQSKAIQTSLSSPNVFGIVTCCEKLSFAFTQKILLLTKENNVLSIVFRSFKQQHVKSAAQARWMLSPHIAEQEAQCWSLQLLHTKGYGVSEKEWLMQCQYGNDDYEEKISLDVFPQLVSQFDPKKIVAAYG